MPEVEKARPGIRNILRDSGRYYFFAARRRVKVGQILIILFQGFDFRRIQLIRLLYRFGGQGGLEKGLEGRLEGKLEGGLEGGLIGGLVGGLMGSRRRDCGVRVWLLLFLLNIQHNIHINME